MTKTQKKSRRVPVYRRPITIIIIILCVIGIAIAAFFILRTASLTDSPIEQPASPVDAPTTDQGDGQSSDVENPPDKTVQYEGENPNQLEELTGSITRRGIANGELTVVASIDQFLSSDSTCRLILKNASGTEVRSTDTVSVDAEATSSACGPLVVSVNQLSGTYTIDVIVTSPDKSGHITTEINI